jgi:hypothetical protein
MCDSGIRFLIKNSETLNKFSPEKEVASKRDMSSLVLKEIMRRIP